jgi:hypothetical protein
MGKYVISFPKEGRLEMKPFALATVFAAVLCFAFSHAAYAKSVDCDKVMEEVNAGKHAKEVAKDMGISVSSVSRCKHKAKQESKASTQRMLPNAGAHAMASSIAAASPSAAASPAAKKK